MKTLATLEGAQFLKQCNLIRHEVENFLKKTDVLSIRKIMPEYTGKETAKEKADMLQQQGKDNFGRMLDRMLDEYPEDTYKILRLMCVTEDGDPEPTGFDVMMVGIEVLSSQQVLDFLSRLVRSGLIDIAN